MLLSDIDAGALNPGVHAFYIRYKDSRGQWSSPVAQFIYKISEQNTGISTNEITAYQYWFDDDYNNAVNQPVTPVQNFVLLSDIDAGALSSGIHAFYIRYKDSRGQWSSPVAQFFYKITVSLSIDNNIVAYRYWFDDDFENAVNLPVIPAQNIFSLTEQIDMTQMWKGEYILYYQFQDTLGMWSSPTIDTIVKNALPIAEFTYSRIENCDSTIIEFHNFSIDGDICVWDFGDGQVSGDSAVSHIYYETGNYLVSLTVTDTLSGRDSTMTELIHIIGPTSNAISETVCDSYTAPSGTVFTETGIYNDTIPNSMSCDSVIEINLTVLETTFSEMNIHACDSFVAPSGDVYYITGQYYDTIPNAVGCDSIIDINLDLGTTSFATIDEDVCDAYLSPAGNIYTESGVYYDTLLNTSGCDSIIDIHLTIRESSSANLIEEVCDEFVSPAGNIYTESGVYYDTIPNAALCDSVIEINLTVLETTFSEMNIHACDSFVAPSGDVYYITGQYYDTIPNAVGCDSIIEINLDLGQTTYLSFSETACDSYTAPSGTVFTETGIYNDTIPNSMSCDSVIEINLTVLETTFSEMNIHACDSFVAPSGDVYYITGQYYDTIPNAVGCDSIIEINLDLGQTTYLSFSETACDSYESPGGNIYNQSGIYYDTIINNSMCDSVIEIDLTIINIDNSVDIVDNTLTAMQNGANYQWLNCDDNMTIISGETNQSFIPSEDGNYAVEITLDICADTSACNEIFGIGIINAISYGIKVFPNPAKEKLYIQFPQTVNRADIEITDISGKIVYQIIEFNTDLVRINFQQKSGVYFLKIKADKHTVIAKVIIYND